MKKEHSAADWSTRPLPEPWLEYAALDVEVLIELRDVLGRRAASRPARTSGRARSSTHLRSFTPAVAQRAVAAYLGPPPGPRPPAPRRRPRAVGDPRRARPRRATSRPGRIIGDSAIVAAALADPDRRARPAGDQGLPRPRRPALRRPLGRGPRAGPRAARGRAARARAPHRRPTDPARLGRARPRRRASGSCSARDGHGPALRGAPGAGREPALPRHRAPGHVGAGRQRCRRDRRPAARARRPRVAGRADRADAGRRGGRRLSRRDD